MFTRGPEQRAKDNEAKTNTAMTIADELRNRHAKGILQREEKS
jgi:hypothetical protein